MQRTLKMCIWSLLGLSVAMTVYMNHHAMDSVIPPALFLPIAILPNILLAALALRPHGLPETVALLVGVMMAFGVGFNCYFERVFVRFTTLNATLFVEVPLIQMVIVLAIWFDLRKRRPPKSPDSDGTRYLKAAPDSKCPIE